MSCQPRYFLSKSIFSSPKQRSLQRRGGFGEQQYSLTALGNLFGLDRVGETFRIKAILAAVGRFTLWVHQVSDFRSARLRQRGIMGIVVGQPVHLPGAEQFVASVFHLRIVQGQLLPWEVFLQN